MAASTQRLTQTVQIDGSSNPTNAQSAELYFVPSTNQLYVKIETATGSNIYVTTGMTGASSTPNA